LALRVIEKLRHGPVTGAKQDRALVTKAPKLKKEDGWIDWTKAAEQVCNQVRAMQPWPTAYTYLHRESKPPQRVIINRANPFPARYDAGVPPGTMFDDQHFPGALFVTAGLLDAEVRTVVEVGELQPAGKKRMSAAEFLRGHPLREGDHFGSEEKS
jgi:methionyl-tRNA formyltransferase